MASTFLQSLAFAATLLAAAVSHASADPRPTQDALPGVDGEYSTVSPVPPEPEELSSPAEKKRFKAGNWDVTISGSVSVGIGFGKRLGGGED